MVFPNLQDTKHKMETVSLHSQVEVITKNKKGIQT